MPRFAKTLVLLTIILFTTSLMPVVSAAKGELLITTKRVMEFSDTSGASSNVVNECTLQTRLPQFIKDYAKKSNVVLAEDVIDITKGRVLDVEIVNVIGAGGGAWSGAKSITVKGQLTDDGDVIGTFTARRYSGGGAFGGFKGTCSILGRCIKAIGKDIATWLAKPTMDARLGDA